MYQKIHLLRKIIASSTQGGGEGGKVYVYVFVCLIGVVSMKILDKFWNSFLNLEAVIKGRLPNIHLKAKIPGFPHQLLQVLCF